MKTIEATYRIVTPMFIGGANQSPNDGIRPPSFKGALRFWWRALNWGKYQNLADLHQKECELFGSAAKKVNGQQVGGQGIFLLTIQELGKRQTLNDWPRANTGAGYLAYGILDSKGGKRGAPVPHQVGIREGLRFTVTLRFHPKAKDEDIKSIEDALDVMGLLGGFGSRSRRGHGSIAKEYNGKLLELPEYKKKLADVFLSQASVAPYTAISHESLMKLTPPNNDPKQALELIGQNYKEYRATILNERSKRVAFGLPLQGVDEKTRRASPLFIHIQALEHQYVGVVSYMPSSEFHHSNSYQNIRFNSVKEFVGGLA